MKLILDIASGKYDTQLFQSSNDIIVHVDRCFTSSFSKTIDEIANDVYQHLTFNNVEYTKTLQHYFCKSDIFEFLDNFPIKCFDCINCNRFFEHLEYCSGEIGRMIEACNVITKRDAEMTFIVPNHEKLAQMILNKNYTDNDVMVINTEFCNIRCDPHLSIWTPELAHRYIDQEATWKIVDIDPNITFAGRNIYMKVTCHKGNGLAQEDSTDSSDLPF